MGTETQVGVLRIDDTWIVYGSRSYERIRDAPTVRGVLRSAKLSLAHVSEWRVFICRCNDQYPYMVLTKYQRPRLCIGLETVGPLVAKGTLDKVWPVFASYVRML